MQSKNDTVLQDVKNFIRNFKSLNETIFAELIEDTHFFNLETLLFEFESENGSINISQLRDEINKILKLNLQVNDAYIVDLVLKQIEGSDYIKVEQITETITDDNGTKEIITGIKISVKDICLLIKECPVIIEILQDIADIKVDITEIFSWLEAIELSIFNIENNITEIEGNITNIEGDITTINKELSKTAEEKYNFKSPNDSIKGGFSGNDLILETDGTGGGGDCNCVPTQYISSDESVNISESESEEVRIVDFRVEGGGGKCIETKYTSDGDTVIITENTTDDVRTVNFEVEGGGDGYAIISTNSQQQAINALANLPVGTMATYPTQNAGGGGGVAGPVEWEDIENKPEAFPPEGHNHSIADVTNLQSSLDGKMNNDRTISINGDVRNLNSNPVFTVGGSNSTVLTAITNATNANVVIIRTGNVVTCYVRGSKSGNNAISFTIPAGYRPDTAISNIALRVGTTDMTITVPVNGAWTSNTANVSGNFTGAMAWTTNEPPIV